MKLFRRRRKNNKGFSLVEVVCAVAILGLASTAVGSAMIMSTQNYQRGNAEVEVQKEAQTTTNLIGNLLIDAVSVSYTEVTNVSKTLVIDGEGKTYTLTYDEGTDVITYEEKITGSPDSVSGTLAENVTNFDLPGFDADAFKASKNATVELAIEKNGKNYEATYSTTARNGAAVHAGAEDIAKIVCESEVTLEPQHSYTMPLIITGLPKDKLDIDYSEIVAVSAGAEVGGASITPDADDNEVVIKLGKESKGTLSFVISVKKASDGTLLDTKTVVINTRRVTSISLLRDINDPAKDKKQDAEYTIYAEALGTNLEKKIGRSYDNDYKNPSPMNFEVTMTGGDFDTYAEIISDESACEDIARPYVKIRLKQDMPAGSTIYITATSKHSLGTYEGTKYTKQGYDYDPVVGQTKITTQQHMTMPNGLRRGDDFGHTQGKEITFDEEMSDVISYLQGRGRQVRFFFRYKTESMTNWTQYYAMSEGGTSLQITAEETYLWAPDEDVEYQMMLASVDMTNKVLYWPADANLFDSSYGFDEYSQGWDDIDMQSEYYYNWTNAGDYSSTFTLPKCEFVYTYKDGGHVDTGVSAGEYVACIGSKSAPIEMTRSQWLYVGIDTLHLAAEKSYAFGAKLQKLDESTNQFEDVDMTTLVSNFSCGNSGDGFKLENIKSTAPLGTYRLCAYIKEPTKGVIDASSTLESLIIDTSYKYSDINVHYGDDSGYVYFKLTN